MCFRMIKKMNSELDCFSKKLSYKIITKYELFAYQHHIIFIYIYG